jgi:hypothetical protein
VDWEVELVVVIGVRAEHVRPGDAWSHVAGLTVGWVEGIGQLRNPTVGALIGSASRRTR